MLAPLNRRRCTLMIIIANDRLEGSATVVLVATDIRQLRLDDDDDDRLFFLFFGSFLFPQPHLPILLNLPPLRKEKKGEKLLNRKWLRPRRPSTEINKNKQTARCAACEIRLPRLKDFSFIFFGGLVVVVVGRLVQIFFVFIHHFPAAEDMELVAVTGQATHSPPPPPFRFLPKNSFDLFLMQMMMNV